MSIDHEVLPDFKNNEDTLKCLVCKQTVENERLQITCNLYDGGSTSPSVVEALEELLPDVLSTVQTEENLVTALDIFVCRRCYNTLGTAMKKKQEALESYQALKQLTSHSHVKASHENNLKDRTSNGMKTTDKDKPLMNQSRSKNLQPFTRSKRSDVQGQCSCLLKDHHKSKELFGKSRKRRQSQTSNFEAGPSAKKKNSFNVEGICKVKYSKNQKEKQKNKTKKDGYENNKLVFETRSGTRYGRNNLSYSSSVINASLNTDFLRSNARQKKKTSSMKVFSSIKNTSSGQKKTNYSRTRERTLVSSQENNKCITASQDNESKQVVPSTSNVCTNSKILVDPNHRLKQTARRPDTKNKIGKSNFAFEKQEHDLHETGKSNIKKHSKSSNTVSNATLSKGKKSILYGDLSHSGKNRTSFFLIKKVDNTRDNDDRTFSINTSSSEGPEEKSKGFDVDCTSVECTLDKENLLLQKSVEILEHNTISENDDEIGISLSKTKDSGTTQVELGTKEGVMKQDENENVRISSKICSIKTFTKDLSPLTESLSGSKHLSCAICEKQFRLHASILRHIRNIHDKDAKAAQVLVIDRKNTPNMSMSKTEAMVKRLNTRKKAEDKTKGLNQFSELDLPPQNDHNDMGCNSVSSDSETVGDGDSSPEKEIITAVSRTNTSRNMQHKDAHMEVFRSKRGRLKDGQNKPWYCSLCPRKYYHKRDGVRHVVRNHGSSFDDARNLIKSSGNLEPKSVIKEDIIVSKVEVYLLDINFSRDRSICSKNSKRTLTRAIEDGLVWQCIECERRMATRKAILRHLDVVHNICGPWARYHVHQVGLIKGLTVKNEGRLDRDLLCVLCGRDYDNKYIASRHFRFQHPDVSEEQENKALIKKSKGAKLVVVTVPNQPSKQQFYQIDDVGRISRVKPSDTSLLKVLVTFDNLASYTELKNQENVNLGQLVDSEELGNDKEKDDTQEELDLLEHIPVSTETTQSDKNASSKIENGTATETVPRVINIDTDHSYLSTSAIKNKCGQEKNTVRWKCNICNTSFKEKVFLTKHRRLHICDGKWVCKMCDKMFPKNFYLLSHIAGVHKIFGNKALDYMKERDKKYTINRCSKDGKESDHILETLTQCSVKENCINTTDVSKTCNEKGVEANCGDHEYQDEMTNSETFKTDILNEEGITVKNIPGCSICDLIFENCKEQTCHLQEVHGFAAQSCTECDQSFLNMSLLQEHMNHIHKNALSKIENCHPCTVCNLLFTSQSELSVHLKQHSASDYQCSLCGSEYTTLSNLSLHMKTHNLTKSVYACSVCGITASDKRDFEKHVQNHYEKYHGPFKCIKCSKQYSSIKSLKKHSAGHGRFVCHYCNRIYESSSSLNSHMKSHTYPTGFQCITCNKSYQSASGYKKHMDKHAGTSIVVCHLCGKVLNTASYLQTHIEVMHRSKKTRRLKDRQCKFCGKTFVRPYQMKRHLVVHTKERPFECQYCSKTFGFRTMYLAHLRKHPEYAPHVCTLCGKTFQVGKEYLDHRIKMHPGIPDSILSEKCQFCDNIFRSKRALLLHVDQVHKEHQHLEKYETFRYSCVICSKSFLYKISLNRHMALQHKQSEPSSTTSNSDSEKPVVSNVVGDESRNESVQKIVNEPVVSGCHFICDICEQPFDDWNELESHLSNEHGEGAQIQVYITSDVQGSVLEEKPTVQLSNNLELALDTVCEVVVSTDLS